MGWFRFSCVKKVSFVIFFAEIDIYDRIEMADESFSITYGFDTIHLYTPAFDHCQAINNWLCKLLTHIVTNLPRNTEGVGTIHHVFCGV